MFIRVRCSLRRSSFICLSISSILFGTENGVLRSSRRRYASISLTELLLEEVKDRLSRGRFLACVPGFMGGDGCWLDWADECDGNDCTGVKEVCGPLLICWVCIISEICGCRQTLGAEEEYCIGTEMGSCLTDDWAMEAANDEEEGNGDNKIEDIEGMLQSNVMEDVGVIWGRERGWKIGESLFDDNKEATDVDAIVRGGGGGGGEVGITIMGSSSSSIISCLTSGV